jgi:DNA-binding NarL/FixJ family response regulator
MIRVLLVDDHPVVRSGYRRLLEQAGDIAIAEAGSAEQAYSTFVRQPVDVCVTDLSLPGMGGLELLHRIMARDDKSRVVVFSMYDSAHLVRRTLDAGARGFVSKQAAPDDMLAAVRAAHAGHRFLSGNLSRHLLHAGTDDESRCLDSLSQREFEVFRLLATGRSAADCAQLLNISQKTAANIQTRVKTKLNVSTSAALVHLALRRGIIASGQG